MRRFSCSVRYAAVLVVVLANLVPAGAQLSTTATIAGNVTDSTGALVPDATVTATDEATKITTERQTGPDGAYVIPSLPVDTYSISISKGALIPTPCRESSCIRRRPRISMARFSPAV